jgi:hypothetical protein
LADRAGIAERPRAGPFGRVGTKRKFTYLSRNLVECAKPRARYTIT